MKLPPAVYGGAMVNGAIAAVAAGVAANQTARTLGRTSAVKNPVVRSVGDCIHIYEPISERAERCIDICGRIRLRAAYR